jgi:hypothetical protein
MPPRRVNERAQSPRSNPRKTRNMLSYKSMKKKNSKNLTMKREFKHQIISESLNAIARERKKSFL